MIKSRKNKQTQQRSGRDWVEGCGLKDVGWGLGWIEGPIEQTNEPGSERMNDFTMQANDEYAYVLYSTLGKEAKNEKAKNTEENASLFIYLHTWWIGC